MDQEDIEKQLALIEDNVNVSKTSDGKEFAILVGGLIGILAVFIIFADFFANIIITCLPSKSQVRIERMFGELPKDNCLNKKYLPEMLKLQKIRKNITDNDKTLVNNGEFPIRFEKKAEVNAWIIPNGTIYFTTGLLDKKFSEEELAFVLAHEIGHYKHRDHLRSISRQIIITFASSIFLSGSDSSIRGAIGNINDFAYYSHSRLQERKADLYASDMLEKLYGSNEGGVKFLSYLEKEDKMPEFMHYFMTHPSTQNRIQLITHRK